MAKRAARQRNQLPTCYYEGYLEKRSFKDKTSRKLWASLCGSTLFFFNEKRDTDYIEKVDISGLISITDDSSQDRNLDAARLILQLKDRSIKFTAPNAEARELWKGYIRSVAELSVPCCLNLLPGQIHMLREVVEKERSRTENVPQLASTNSGDYVTLKADMPACYHNVSRPGAELLLERESRRGNLLLRPGSNGNSFAISTRQDLEGSVFRHYRVTRTPDGGFAIDVQNPVACPTLHAVIHYLVEKTDGVLIPLIIEGTYEKSISYIRSDKENGERSVQQATSNPAPPSLPPKAAARTVTPEPAPAPVVEDSFYLNEKPEEKEKETEDISAAPPPKLDKKPAKKAIMPPSPAPRKFSSSSISSTSSTSSSSSSSSSTCASVSTSQEPRMKLITESLGQIPFAAMSELKLMLGHKVRCID